jgi:hypothetical protein
MTVRTSPSRPNERKFLSAFFINLHRNPKIDTPGAHFFQPITFASTNHRYSCVGSQMANPIDQFNSQEFTVNHEFLNSSICQPTLDSPSPNAQNIIVVAQHTSDTQPPVFRTMNSSPISRIPNELLDNILAYILPQQDPLGRYWRQRQVIAASISLTSKRFNQITQPLLYHTIFLANFTSFQLIPPGQNTKLFFRTMESKPALRALCKSLTIRISIRDLDEKDISKSTSLLLWLTNVRNFHVSGGFDSPSIMSMLCSALQNMPFVDNLKLSPDSPPSLAQVYKHFVFPQLRALSLESAVEGSHSGSAIGLIPQVSKEVASLSAPIAQTKR